MLWCLIHMVLPWRFMIRQVIVWYRVVDRGAGSWFMWCMWRGRTHWGTRTLGNHRPLDSVETPCTLDRHSGLRIYTSRQSIPPAWCWWGGRGVGGMNRMGCCARPPSLSLTNCPSPRRCYDCTRLKFATLHLYNYKYNAHGPAICTTSRSLTLVLTTLKHCSPRGHHRRPARHHHHYAQHAARLLGTLAQ